MPLPVNPGNRTPDKVDQAIRARAAQRLRETALGPDHPVVLAAIAWQALRTSSNSAAGSVANLKPFFEFCARRGLDPFRIGRDDARAYLVEQESLAYAPATIALRGAFLSSFFGYAIDKGLAAANPFHRLKAGNREPVTPTPSLTAEQCDRVIAMTSRGVLDGTATIHDHRNAAMAYLMIRVGPRRMEVVDATWGALTPLGDGVVWRVHGKRNRWGSTALPVDVAAVLEDWRAALEGALGRPVRAAEPLFPNLGPGRTMLVSLPRGSSLRPLGRNSVSAIFKRKLLEAGISGARYSAHAARATAATRAYEATRDVVAVQHMLRHRDQSTTLRYIRHATTSDPAAHWQPKVAAPIRPTTSPEAA